MDKKCEPQNGYQTKTPEALLRADQSTTSPKAGAETPKGLSTEPGNPGAYDNERAAVGEGY